MACIEHCPTNAIEIVEDKAKIDSAKCIGCGECIIVCPEKAVLIQWNKSVPDFIKGLVEYAKGSLFNKKDRAFFINFITDVTPLCDCLPYNDAPIVRNIGILASRDPVAIDKASVDLVNKERALENSCLTVNKEIGEDKFKGLHPKVDWEIHFEHAEKIGFFSSNYELVMI